MKRVILLTAIAACTSFGQAPAPVIVEREHVKVIHGAAGESAAPATFAFLSAESTFEAADIKGAPFSGDFVTESVQILGDGNRIRNSSTASYARDGEGRTRREMSIDAIGPWAANGPWKSIFIHDPVAKINYVIDPQAKTVRKMAHLAGLPPMQGGGATAGRRLIIRKELKEGPEEGKSETVMFEQKIGQADVLVTPPTAGIIISDGGGPAPAPIVAQAGQRIEAGKVDVKTEPLGKRVIAGVEAQGTRTIVTIPAGQIGNDLPLETISERWYSDELKTVVLSTRKDPRTGETTYQLTNLRRGEPSRLLFEAPTDYRLIEEGGRPEVFKMRMKKQE